MKILLIGPPASGKGTIGELLSAYLNLPIVNAGQLLRDVETTSIWHEPINSAMENGEMVHPKIVGNILAETLQEPKYKNGFIMDGWLRQRADFEVFDPQIDWLIYLNISEEISKLRILNRVVCSKCKRNYNTVTNPSKKSGVCDVDGAVLEKRTDDTAEALEKRLSIFRNETLLVIDSYRKQGKLIEIDGSGTPDEVFKTLVPQFNLKINDVII